MNSEVIVLDNLLSKDVIVESSLSFNMFLQHIRDRTLTESSIKKDFFKFIFGKFNSYTASQIRQSKEIRDTLLELVYLYMVPAVAREDNMMFAITLPLNPHFIYKTKVFHSFLEQRATQKDELLLKDELNMQKFHLRKIYALILNRLYNRPNVDEPYIQAYQLQGGPIKYMDVNFNNDYIDVKLKDKHSLPAVDLKQISTGTLSDEILQHLQSVLPLHLFSFEGFSVLTAQDMTTAYVIEKIKGIMLSQKFESPLNAQRDLSTLLKSLVDDNEIEFGLLPVFEISGKKVLNFDGRKSTSYLNDAARELQLPEMEVAEFLRGFSEHSSPSIYHKDSVIEIPFLQKIFQTKIQSLGLMPIYFGDAFVAILEMYSFRAGVIHDDTIDRINPILPWMGQLMKWGKEVLDLQMERIIKDEFTSLQNSVEWKFKELIWNSLKDNCFEVEHRNIGTVSFENVYPLYGAVDIRNSTVERSRALKADFKTHLQLLLEVLKQISEVIQNDLIDEKYRQAEEFLQEVTGQNSIVYENDIYHFLEHEVNDVLLTLDKNNNKLIPLVNNYFKIIKDKNHQLYKSRVMLEESMRIINSNLNSHLKTFQLTLQDKYPCYFESFRTDGVEYDIYTGQSISPNHVFNHATLEEFRLLQLSSMASIIKLLNGVRNEMPIPLQTTQLIFVHENPIDIKFRKDEKRFDVEGAYNVRYQVVKKRIDKVQIKGTGERLTQPGKIAIVYMSESVGVAYQRHIKTLQKEGLVQEFVEKLELEDLQGVIGLKALRVSVSPTLSCLKKWAKNKYLTTEFLSSPL